MQILKYVLDHFSHLLIDSKFEIYHGKALGKKSGIVLLRNNIIKIKVVSDKENVFTEIGSSRGPDWCDLSIFRYYQDKTPIGLMDEYSQASYIKQNLHRIEKIYSIGETIEQLEKLKFDFANRITPIS